MAKVSNNERRITVLRTLWPRLQALAERDGVHVGDVINAILLQTLGPYGTTAPCSCGHSYCYHHQPGRYPICNHVNGHLSRYFNRA